MTLTQQIGDAVFPVQGDPTRGAAGHGGHGSSPAQFGAMSLNGSGLAAALGLHVEDLVADQPPKVVWAGLRFGRRCLQYWRPGDGSTTRLASSVLEVWQAPPRSVRRTSVTCHRRCGMVISMTTASPTSPTAIAHEQSRARSVLLTPYPSCGGGSVGWGRDSMPFSDPWAFPYVSGSGEASGSEQIRR